MILNIFFRAKSVVPFGEALKDPRFVGWSAARNDPREGFERYRRVDQAVAEVAQCLPECRASAGPFLNAGEDLGARLLGPNDLTQYLFEKEVIIERNRGLRAISF